MPQLLCARCRDRLSEKEIPLPIARVLAPWWRRLWSRLFGRRLRAVRMLPENCAPPASLRTNLHNSTAYASVAETGAALQKLNRAMGDAAWARDVPMPPRPDSRRM